MGRKHGQAVYDAVYKMHLQGTPHKQIAATLSLPLGTVQTIIFRMKRSTGASYAETERKHAEKVAEMQEAHAQETTWMAHIEPLNAHKRQLEAEVAAKADALRKAREELDNFRATLKELTS